MAQSTDGPGNANNATPDQFLESLGRLSKKAGVLATVVLDRPSGAILNTTGNVSLIRASSASNTSSALNAASNASNESDSGSGNLGAVEQMAAMVWNFVNITGGLVQGLDAEDEVRLLRLRTKKHELVIVPDTKYLLVVIHETPPA